MFGNSIEIEFIGIDEQFKNDKVNKYKLNISYLLRFIYYIINIIIR